jgi:hypothetical protein
MEDMYSTALILNCPFFGRAFFHRLHYLTVKRTAIDTNTWSKRDLAFL